MTKPEFTRRELQVLTLLAQGVSNIEIAKTLGISDHTAKFHVNSVFAKTGQHTRLGAVVCALKHGIISLESLMTEIPLVPYTFQTAMGAAILEENKQAMQEQKDNFMENIVNDIIEELYDNTIDKEVAAIKITGVLKEYFSDA